MTEDKKDSSNKALDLLRKERNQEILRKMRAGESLTSFDSQASWFPERPKIEKNLEAIQKLYGNSREKAGFPSSKESNLKSSIGQESAAVIPLVKGQQKSSIDKQKP
jgi:hypothetical protein